ncbi:MAG: hypothetical protein Tsb0021_15210 [Chlamydiales bacterium]
MESVNEISGLDWLKNSGESLLTEERMNPRKVSLPSLSYPNPDNNLKHLQRTLSTKNTDVNQTREDGRLGSLRSKSASKVTDLVKRVFGTEGKELPKELKVESSWRNSYLSEITKEILDENIKNKIEESIADILEIFNSPQVEISDISSAFWYELEKFFFPITFNEEEEIKDALIEFKLHNIFTSKLESKLFGEKFKKRYCNSTIKMLLKSPYGLNHICKNVNIILIGLRKLKDLDRKEKKGSTVQNSLIAQFRKFEESLTHYKNEEFIKCAEIILELTEHPLINKYVINNFVRNRLRVLISKDIQEEIEKSGLMEKIKIFIQPEIKLLLQQLKNLLATGEKSDNKIPSEELFKHISENSLIEKLLFGENQKKRSKSAHKEEFLDSNIIQSIKIICQYTTEGMINNLKEIYNLYQHGEYKHTTDKLLELSGNLLVDLFVFNDSTKLKLESLISQDIREKIEEEISEKITQLPATLKLLELLNEEAKKNFVNWYFEYKEDNPIVVYKSAEEVKRYYPGKKLALKSFSYYENEEWKPIVAYYEALEDEQYFGRILRAFYACLNNEQKKRIKFPSQDSIKKYASFKISENEFRQNELKILYKENPLFYFLGMVNFGIGSILTDCLRAIFKSRTHKKNDQEIRWRINPVFGDHILIDTSDLGPIVKLYKVVDLYPHSNSYIEFDLRKYKVDRDKSVDFLTCEDVFFNPNTDYFYSENIFDESRMLDPKTLETHFEKIKDRGSLASILFQQNLRLDQKSLQVQGEVIPLQAKSFPNGTSTECELLLSMFRTVSDEKQLTIDSSFYQFTKVNLSQSSSSSDSIQA